MSAGFRITQGLWDKIHHFASFQQTGGQYHHSQHHSYSTLKPRSFLVSLQQMVLFGQNPTQGTLLKASQFLAGEIFNINVIHHTPLINTEELPVRLAHRVKELDQLPHNLSDMPSIKKVKNWYAQSFEVCSINSSSIEQIINLLLQGINQLSTHHFGLSLSPSSHGP